MLLPLLWRGGFSADLAPLFLITPLVKCFIKSMFPDSYLLSEGFSSAGKPVAEVGKAEANNPFMKVTQSQQGLAKKKQTYSSCVQLSCRNIKPFGKRNAQNSFK